MRTGQLVTFYDGHATGRTQVCGTSSVGVPSAEKQNVITVTMKKTDVGLVVTQTTHIDDRAGHEYSIVEVLVFCNGRLGWFLADDLKIVRNSVKRSVRTS